MLKEEKSVKFVVKIQEKECYFQKQMKKRKLIDIFDDNGVNRAGHCDPVPEVPPDLTQPRPLYPPLLCFNN